MKGMETMRPLILLLILAGAAFADSRETAGAMHHWTLTATGTSQLLDLTNSSDAGPGPSTAYGPAKSIKILAPASGTITFALNKTTVAATPVNGTSAVPLASTQTEGYAANGSWTKLAYISQGTTVTFEVVTLH